MSGSSDSEGERLEDARSRPFGGQVHQLLRHETFADGLHPRSVGGEEQAEQRAHGTGEPVQGNGEVRCCQCSREFVRTELVVIIRVRSRLVCNRGNVNMFVYFVRAIRLLSFVQTFLWTLIID